MLHTSMLTQRAEEFVRERHSNHFRKGGEPFFNHLHRIAQKVKDKGGSSEAVAAAFLHDSIEDGKATSLEIDRLFGCEVYKIVCILTKKNDMTYDQYVDSIVASHNKDAIMIKIADNEDNLSSCGNGAFPPEKEDILRARWQKCKLILESVLT
jgi:(p)ppGpp synthase/HD superfamily hydrolase